MLMRGLHVLGARGRLFGLPYAPLPGHLHGADNAHGVMHSFIPRPHLSSSYPNHLQTLPIQALSLSLSPTTRKLSRHQSPRHHLLLAPGCLR